MGKGSEAAGVRGTGEFGQALNLQKTIDRRNPKEKFRTREQFALFGLRFKVSDEERHSKLFCTITIDDSHGSEDIYRGILPTAEGGDAVGDYGYCDLLLTGPQKFVGAQNAVTLSVAIYDVDNPELSDLLPPVHVCDDSCEFKSCGSYPLSKLPEYLGLLIWIWDPFKGFTRQVGYGEVSSIDLISNDVFWGSKLVAHLYGSLVLDFAAFENAVVAKVKVELKASLHRICGAIMIKAAVIVKKKGFPDDDEEIGIMLLQKPASSDENINTEEEEEEESPEQLLPLQLCRSSVTLPPTVLIVKAILRDKFNHNEIVNGFVKFSAERSGTSKAWIPGGKIQVTVTWT